jgi:GT2 family glycosyltransferase
LSPSQQREQFWGSTWKENVVKNVQQIRRANRGSTSDHYSVAPRAHPKYYFTLKVYAGQPPEVTGALGAWDLSKGQSTGLRRGSGFSIRVQSILYHLPLENIIRSLEFLDAAAFNAGRATAAHQIAVAYGDCSSTPILDEKAVTQLRGRFSNLIEISYAYFGANLGSARGHNTLLSKSKRDDLVMILNPDVLVSPTLFDEMLNALSRPGVGLVEARQLPIEHPKHYDPDTGETGWASTACALAPKKLFDELGGFDADSFFLYGDDVDFSWRMRLAGHRIVHECNAVVFHDKRLSQQGGWISTTAERYYSAEAALLLSHKYSRPDLTEEYLHAFSTSGDENLKKAYAAFELRRKTGRLPTPIDPDHRVAEFVEGAYAPHRFISR